MASMQDRVNFSTHPYSKVLLLGAIAAASAFLITILILVFCIGCERKGKTHNGTGEKKHRLMDMRILRQSKLRCISQSDTKLHEKNRLNCNSTKSFKNRPASMDLLLPSSNSDLRSEGLQLPQIPAGEVGTHTHTEVSPVQGSEDARYGVTGRTGVTDTPAPPAVPANTPAPPDPDGDCLEGGISEPETLPQVVNTPPQPQKRDNGTDTEEGLRQQCHSSEDIQHAPPTYQVPPPLHPHNQKHVEAFVVPSFPKEPVFMGNGEQYIWKPAEDDIILQHRLKGQAAENMSVSAAGITEMYSKVCKTGIVKRGLPDSPAAVSGYRTLALGERDRGFRVVLKPQTWAPQEGKGLAAPPGCLEDRCYEAISTEETDLSYGTMGHDRSPPNGSGTLRPKRKRPQQPLQQPPPPPPRPPQQSPKPQHLPAKSLMTAGDSLYDSIPALKLGSTTTIFTFNDGMELYVTGL